MEKSTKHIDHLLDLYWQGETTLVQEEELHSYFNGEKIAEDHQTYTPLFKYFKVQSTESTDIDVEKVLANIESLSPVDNVINRIISLKRFRLGIAASLTLLLSVVTFMNIQNQQESQYKIVLSEDHETREALRITKDALALLSGNIDKSTQQVKHGVSKVGAASILK